MNKRKGTTSGFPVFEFGTHFFTKEDIVSLVGSKAQVENGNL
jgi:hypothetical protein